MSDYVEDAGVQYDDWVGTAAADTADDPATIAEALGLDSDEWWVMGLTVSNYQGTVVVTAQCMRWDLLGEDETIDNVAMRHGGDLPVTAIAFDGDELGGTFDAVIERLFKRFTVQLFDKYSVAEEGGRRLRIENRIDFVDLTE